MIRHFPFNFNLKHSWVYARYALPVTLRQYSTAFWGIHLELLRDWKRSSIAENILLAVTVTMLQGHWREGVLLLAMPVWGYAFVPQLGLKDSTHHNRAYASTAAWAVFLSFYSWWVIPLIVIWIIQSESISRYYRTEQTFWTRCYVEWFQKRDDTKLFQDFLSDYSHPVKVAYIRVLKQQAARAIRDGDMEQFSDCNRRILKLDPEGKIL